MASVPTLLSANRWGVTIISHHVIEILVLRNDCKLKTQPTTGHVQEEAGQLNLLLNVAGTVIRRLCQARLILKRGTFGRFRHFTFNRG